MVVWVQLPSRVLCYFKSLVSIDFQGFFVFLGTLLGTGFCLFRKVSSNPVRVLNETMKTLITLIIKIFFMFWGTVQGKFKIFLESVCINEAVS